jgi:streptogramin lyase
MTLLALALFAPQMATLVQQWSLASRRVTAVSVFSGADTALGVAQLALMQAWWAVRAFVLLDPNLPYYGRYNELGAGVIDPVTGLLYVAGLWVGVRRWRETAHWWLALVLGLFAIQVLARGTPDGARAVPFAPVMYLFVALPLAEILRRPSLQPLRWALVLGVPLVVQMTVADFFGWMTSPELAKVRQPAVEASEFDAWLRLQLAEAREGKPGFNAMQWQDRRPEAVKRPVATPGPDGSTPDSATIPVTQGADARTVGRVSARVGGGDDGPKWGDPRGIAIDGAGNVFVADAGNARVVKLDSKGKLVLQWGRRGDEEGELQEPFDLAVDPQGRVCVLDSERGVIQRYSADGQYEQTLLDGVDAYHPRGIAIDAAGRLYVADTGRNRVLQLSPDGELIKTWDKAGGQDLDQPTDVAVDRSGNLYVVEPEARRLQKLDLEGSVLARRSLAPSNTRDGPHLALGPRGQVLLADPGSARVVTLDDRLMVQARLGGAGLEWKQPIGVAVGKGGDVWVVDAANALVVRVSDGL